MGAPVSLARFGAHFGKAILQGDECAAVVAGGRACAGAGDAGCQHLLGRFDGGLFRRRHRFKTVFLKRFEQLRQVGLDRLQRRGKPLLGLVQPLCDDADLGFQPFQSVGAGAFEVARIFGDLVDQRVDTRFQRGNLRVRIAGLGKAGLGRRQARGYFIEPPGKLDNMIFHRIIAAQCVHFARKGAQPGFKRLHHRRAGGGVGAVEILAQIGNHCCECIDINTARHGAFIAVKPGADFVEPLAQLPNRRVIAQLALRVVDPAAQGHHLVFKQRIVVGAVVSFPRVKPVGQGAQAPFQQV